MCGQFIPSTLFSALCGPHGAPGALAAGGSYPVGDPGFSDCCSIKVTLGVLGPTPSS